VDSGTRAELPARVEAEVISEAVSMGKMEAALFCAKDTWKMHRRLGKGELLWIFHISLFDLGASTEKSKPSGLRGPGGWGVHVPDIVVSIAR
jgi:hypothetical protein